MPNERLLILFNPSAGMGTALKRKGALEEILGRHGIRYDLIVTRSEEHLRELTREKAHQYGTLVGAGGDSTFHIMVNEIVASGAAVKFGMIAVGSSNDIAQEFTVDSLGKACLALKKGRTKKTDLGVIEVGEKPVCFFLGQANIGLGVFVNQYVAQRARRNPNLAAPQALMGTIGILRAYRKKMVPFHLVLESESVRSEGEFVAVVISNVRYWATGKIINPEARIDDGRLDACLIRTCSFSRLARISWLANSGWHARAKEVEIFQAPRFKISSEMPFEIQSDGEIIGSPDYSPFHKATVRVVPQTLDIICSD